MTHDIIFSDATQLAKLVRTKQLSPVEVVRAHLDRIEAGDPKVNAIVTVADGARAAAKGPRRRSWPAMTSGHCTACRSP